MDQKLLILVTYHAKPGRGREFLREIEKHGLRETILKEDGCLRYDYYLASDTDDTVLLVEQWQTPAHQSAHMEQAHMKTLLELKTVRFSRPTCRNTWYRGRQRLPEEPGRRCL